jgi:HNH endonuclease
MVRWADALGRSLGEIAAVIEPCLRQSVLMTLIPAKVFDARYTGTIDAAIREHVGALGITLSDDEVETLRDVCINARRLRGLDRRQARSRSASMATLRGNPTEHRRVRQRQNDRCIWCGVELTAPYITQSLEHVIPKHLGDDPADGKNWAISCQSCNEGKGDGLAWAATPQAHDYFSRNDFDDVNHLSLSHRFAVLRRSNRCEDCDAPPSMAELWVFRRVPTGLPVPANCGVICSGCATRRPNVEILVPRWSATEAARPAAPT